MTTDEFKAARHSLGLSVAELAFVLNTNDRTLRRWIDGERSVNPIAGEAMRWMTEDNYEPPRLRWILAGHRADEWEGE